LGSRQAGIADAAAEVASAEGTAAPLASPAPPSSAALAAPSPPVPAPLPPYARRVLCQVGVIDLLQFFDNSKRVEHVYKTMLERDRDAEVSAVEPVRYAQRFGDFARGVFLPGAPLAS
jgi:hypothetical protein